MKARGRLHEVTAPKKGRKASCKSSPHRRGDGGVDGGGGDLLATMLPPDLAEKVEASEYLALDNLLLARRAAEAERQLERERRSHTVGGQSIMGSLLLGWSASRQEQEVDTAAELKARADENITLQHAIINQQQDAQVALKAQAHRGGACISMLKRALRDADAEVLALTNEARTSAVEHARAREDSRQSVETLHGVCRELRSRCASTLDELEASSATIAQLKHREGELQKWKASVRDAWAREQDERKREQERYRMMESQLDERCNADAEDLQAEAAAAAAADEQEGVAVADKANAASSTPVPEREPDWLTAAAHAVSLAEIVEADSPPASSGGGDKDERAAWRERHATSEGAFEDEEGGDDGLLDASGAGGSAREASALRAALQRERDARAAAEARAAEAEARAAVATEERTLSCERFQQQIATLSDALAELHAKEDARRRRQIELRERRQNEHQQQPTQQQPPPPPQRDEPPTARRGVLDREGGAGPASEYAEAPPVVDAEAYAAAEREASMLGKASSMLGGLTGGLGTAVGLGSAVGGLGVGVGEGLGSLRLSART